MTELQQARALRWKLIFLSHSSSLELGSTGLIRSLTALETRASSGLRLRCPYHIVSWSDGYLNSSSYIQTPGNKSEEGWKDKRGLCWLSLVTVSNLFFPKDTKPFHFTFHLPWQDGVASWLYPLPGILESMYSILSLPGSWVLFTVKEGWNGCWGT